MTLHFLTFIINISLIILTFNMLLKEILFAMMTFLQDIDIFSDN